MKNITKYVKQIPLLFALFAFLAINKLGAQSCVHTIQLTDTYGDGWNGGAVAVSVGGTAVTGLTNLTLASGAGPVSFTFNVTAGQTIRVYRTLAGSYPSEMRIKVINSIGTTIINTIQPVTGTASSGGTTGVGACSAPTPPANDLCANAVSLACASGNISGTTVNPLQFYDNYTDEVILILQRGVDPYSPKYANKYGIGKILGLPSEDDLTIEV